MASRSPRSAFSADDIFLHDTLSKLSGGPAQRWLLFPVRRARRESDDYETTLWGLQPGHDREARRLTSPVFDASYARLHPKDDKVAFVSRRGDDGSQVFVLPLDGGEAQQLTRPDGVKLSTLEAWSNDGTRLLATASVACTEDGEDRDGSAGRPPQVATYLPYKQDGNGIIVGRRTHLYAIDAGNGELRALTEGDFDVVAGAWSPDGRRIALAGAETEGDSQVGLWLADASSGAVRRLGGEDFELSPSSTLEWHPDGTRIAVVADIRGLHRIAVVGVDDGTQRVLSRGLRSVQTLAQCDGRLAFVAMGMRRLNDVHTCEWDGSGERRITRLNRWFLQRPRPRVRKRWFEVPDGSGGSERIEA